jgi:hypothetical protein
MQQYRAVGLGECVRECGGVRIGEIVAAGDWQRHVA